MKKLLGIVVLGLLWCNVGLAKDFYEIEKFKCKYNKSAAGGYHDFGGTREKKIYTRGVNDIATWNIKISNINHKERTAYLILLDDVVRNIHIINPQKEFGNYHSKLCTLLGNVMHENGLHAYKSHSSILDPIRNIYQ